MPTGSAIQATMPRQAWTVYLDLDHNQLHGTGEPSAVTGVDGRYAFSDLTPRNYLVRAINQPNWLATAPAEVFATPVANGGFESGAFAPEWSTIGVASVTTTIGDVAAPEGAKQAAVNTTKNSVSGTALSEFIGRPATLIGDTVVEGSGIKRTISATAGQTLSFQWNFFTDQSRRTPGSRWARQSGR